HLRRQAFLIREVREPVNYLVHLTGADRADLGEVLLVGRQPPLRIEGETHVRQFQEFFVLLAWVRKSVRPGCRSKMTTIPSSPARSTQGRRSSRARSEE